jgi:hypothetical protein
MTEHRHNVQLALALRAVGIPFGRRAIALLLAGWLLSTAAASDLPGVLPAALDQPRVNVALRRTPTGTPITVDLGGGLQTFNIQAFYDTGASGILLSEQTADALEIERLRWPNVNSPLVEFEDVGVAGTDLFNVSEPLYASLAPYPGGDGIDDPAQHLTVYNQTFGQLRTQIGPLGGVPNPLLEGLDIFGMPTMASKVIVMDPKPVDPFANPIPDVMRTYIYNPGTPFNPNTADTNPGIPSVDRHVDLSYGAFDRFTQVTPAGAPGPTLRNNPFIGPNPVLQLDPNPPADDTPPVSITFGNQSSDGSWLLDTGAAASIISKTQAANLHVRYRPGTEGTDNPRLETYDPMNPGAPGQLIADQFTLDVGGIGGIAKRSGFYLDSLLMRTAEGNPADDEDPNHIRYLGAAVLVSDITVQDPITEQSLTLDGIFGMNMMVATASFRPGPIPDIEALADGYFNWITFDEPAGVLGFDLKDTISLPPNEWLRSSSGIWGDPNNWSYAEVPNGNDVSVMLGPALTSSANVDLQATSRTVRTLRFSHESRSYTVTSSGGGALILEAASGPASIQFDIANSASHAISAPIRIKSNVDFHGLLDDLQLTLSGGQTWDAGRSLTVRSGNLRYDLDSADAVSVGGDNTLVIDDGATVTLAGTETPLAAGGNFVDVINHHESGLIVESGHHDVGLLTGEGSTIVESGSTLTTDRIEQSSLSIGVGSVVTIRPGSGTSVLGGLTFLSSPAPAPDAHSAASAVPEPGTLVLAAMGTFVLGLLFRRQRRRA